MDSFNVSGNELALLILTCFFFVVLIVLAIINELEILELQGEAPSPRRTRLLKEKTENRMPILTGAAIACAALLMLVRIQQAVPRTVEALFVALAVISLVWFLLLTRQIRREDYLSTHAENPRLCADDTRNIQRLTYHKDEAKRLRNFRIVPILGTMLFSLLAFAQYFLL